MSLAIGDKVRVIGPAYNGCMHAAGETFRITMTGCYGYAGDYRPWYPASSLELVEEKKPDRLAAIERTLELQTRINAEAAEKLDLAEQANANIERKLDYISARLTAQAVVNNRVQKKQEYQEQELAEHARYIQVLQECEIERISRFPKGFSVPEPDVVSKILDEPALQVGDWAEIIGNSWSGRNAYVGQIGKIWEKTDAGNFQIWNIGFFPCDSLRPLTDDEIARRLNT